MDVFLGIDVGSVSTNLAVLNDNLEVIYDKYLRTSGRPIDAVQRAISPLAGVLPQGSGVVAAGATGSARRLAGELVGADIVKNEITAHSVAAIHLAPDVHTVIEIGGQDSKIIIIRNQVAVDFAMNTICAAGTGSFLDQQANRLTVPIEEFGELALASESPVRIAGRCTVFAESDMIHKQQMGHRVEDIVAGLCQALVRNYLGNVAKGKEILPPVVFQGGVAANAGIRKALAEELRTDIIVPDKFGVMGAVGAALLAHEWRSETGARSRFRGFAIGDVAYRTTSLQCNECPNLCEVIEVLMNGSKIAGWGDRCGRYQTEKKEVPACEECVTTPSSS
ncbi:MAG: 2-hydroxyglutaryl-CoA dehydratase [Candidatus Eiseniibacteriota bacterium]|nr:MAG: 2-hydroxyglutaryl-CoA dehydratase [Candidatus Eisenbacteria bacterium]